MLILTSLGELDRRALTAVWVIPLLFTVFNASPLQLLFVAFPDAMETSLVGFARYGVPTLARARRPGDRLADRGVVDRRLVLQAGPGGARKGPVAVELSIPLRDGPLAEVCRSLGRRRADYPTGRLQKGLLLLDGREELAEEGVGLRGADPQARGSRPSSPARVELDWRRRARVWEVTRRLRAWTSSSASPSPAAPALRSGALYAAKDSLAALHRRVPPLRGPLTAASAALRRVFGWVTTYEQAPALRQADGDVHHRRRGRADRRRRRH